MRKIHIFAGSSVCLIVGATILASGCSDEPLAPLPASFRIEGCAAGDVGSLSITCDLEWSFETTGPPSPVPGGVSRVPVRWGGHAQRTVLEPDGSGISLAPDLFSPDSYVLIFPGNAIEIVTPASVDDPTPFYRELGTLRGTIRGDGWGSGTWRCGPFETRGDDTGIVDGIWILSPLPSP